MKLIETLNKDTKVYALDYYYMPDLNFSIYSETIPTKTHIKKVHKAMCTYDKIENVYTMGSLDKGGPIIMDADINKLILKYIDAFITVLSVKALMHVINTKKLDA